MIGTRAMRIPARVVGGLASNAYGQLVTALIAIGGVPIFLAVWPVEVYGQWLLLMTVPSYLAVCDFGISAAATNRLVMGRFNTQGHDADGVFQSALMIVSAVASVICLLSIPLAIAGERYALWSAKPETIIALAAYSAASLLTGLVDGAMRANGYFAGSTFALNTVRLLEWLAAVAALFVWGTVSAVSATLAVSRVLLTISLIAFCSTRLETPRWGVRSASLRELRETASAALSFATYPVSNAVTLQGASLIVGSFAGPAAVVTFNCYRTATRLVTQLLGLINRAFWPEFSLAFAQQSVGKLRDLVRQCQLANVTLGGAAVLVTVTFGDRIVEAWTHGHVTYEPLYFSIMALGTFATCFWQTRWVAMMACNRHSRFSILFLFSSIVFVAAASGCQALFPAWTISLPMLGLELLIYFLAKQCYEAEFAGLDPRDAS